MVLQSDRLTRRDCMKAGAVAAASALSLGTAGALAPEGARAAVQPEKYDILLPRVRFECKEDVVDIWNTGPGGDRNLLEEAARALKIRVRLQPGVSSYDPYYGEEQDFNAVVDLSNTESLKTYSMLLMTSEGSFDLTRTERFTLKRYVEDGGFMLMDDCVYEDGDYFYRSACGILEEIFGRGSVVSIPRTHQVFNSFYDLTGTGLPTIGGVNHGAKGVMLGNRLGVFLSSTDIHCGWVDRDALWYPRDDSGRTGYEDAIRMGINIIKYVLATAPLARAV